MKSEVIAVIVQEGSRFISELIRTRPRKVVSLTQQAAIILPEEPPGDLEETPQENKATAVATGCLPCSLGHLGTCSGLMAESLRFGRKDGIQSDEVISRINLCLDELNSLERVDLRPEQMINLPDGEKELANKALLESRNARHQLESISTVEELERVAADIQSARQSIGQEWFKQRLAKMPKEEKAKLAQKAIERLEGVG